ncbi:50S ribosomal protein L4 [Candidatus Blochmanniella vafra]|nr:50S ribosomal protein L4 [Candidatus Blochmannia vafer]
MLPVSEKIFKYPFNMSLIHQVVSSYLINSRQGSRSQKSRAEVSGSNKKPWRQKGTGRARSGSLKSPIWRSGGVTFAAKPKKYNQKINKKMYKGAIKSILSKLVSENRLLLIENLFLEKPKTKLFLEKLNCLIALNKSMLFITDMIESNVLLATRNLYKVEVRDLYHMDPVSLVKFDIVIFTKKVLNKIETALI